MKYSDFFFLSSPRRFIVKRHEFPKVLSIFVAAVHFFERNRFFLLCLATERSTHVISGLGEGGMDETSFFTGKLTLLESSGRRNTRLLRFDTCASRGRFFFFSRVRAWKPCEAKWWKKDRGGEVNKNDFILLENNSHVCEYIVRGYLYRKLINEKRLLIAGLTAI